MPPQIRCDGSAGGGAETVVVIARLWRIGGREVVLPGVRADVAVQVVLVDSAMPFFVTALGDDLRLRSRRVVEVGRLTGGRYLELLNAVLWHRHYATGTGRAGKETADAGVDVTAGVDALSAVHIAELLPPSS